VAKALMVESTDVQPRDPATEKLIALAERVRVAAKALEAAMARVLSVRGALEQAEQAERNATHAFEAARVALLTETIGDANVKPR
jgi:hypothetical protein